MQKEGQQSAGVRHLIGACQVVYVRPSASQSLLQKSEASQSLVIVSIQMDAEFPEEQINTLLISIDSFLGLILLLVEHWKEGYGVGWWVRGSTP